MQKRKSIGGGKAPVEEQQFAFPNMSVDEILNCLGALDMKVSEEQFKNISNDKVLYRTILENMCEICVGVTRDEMAQPVFAGLSSLDHLNLHDESVPFVNSFRNVSKMMRISGISNFSMRDYLNPDQKRFRRQLSGIINFAKFREERFTMLQDSIDSRETLIQGLNDTKDENERFTEKLANLRKANEEEEKVIVKVEEEVNGIEADISRLNNKQAEIREEISELKSLNNSLKDGISARSLQLEENMGTKKSLQGQIVSSPERFRKGIMDVQQSVQTELRDTKVADKKLRDLAGWLTTLEEAQAEVDRSLSSMRDVRAAVDAQKASNNELASKQDEVGAQREALSTLDQNTHQLLRHASRAEEKLQHLRKQASSRGEEGALVAEDLHKQLLEAEGMGVQARNRAERAEGEAKRVEREVEAEAQAMKEERDDMTRTYERLEKIAIGHLQNVQKALDENTPQLSAHPSQTAIRSPAVTL